MRVYKFSETATENPPDILHGTTVDGFLFRKFQDDDCPHGLYTYGVYKVLGWEFNFIEELHQYYFTSFETYNRIYAPSIDCVLNVFPDAEDIRQI
jgi:hypothetical protein